MTSPCKKTAYADEWQADNALGKIWRLGWKSGPGKLPLRAYHCPTCGLVHLTSQPLKRERVSR